MSNLILCKTKEAAKPFHLNDCGLNIYSLEELCFFVYKNIYVLNDDFFSEDLLLFIDNEIGEHDLVRRLVNIKEQNGGLLEMVITLFMYVDLYSLSEIEEIKGTIRLLNNQSLAERLKFKGDAYLETGKISSAIKSYEKAFSIPEDKKLTDEFYGQLNHNLGVAYAKLFLYEKALVCFNEAYRINASEKSKDCAIAARLLARKKDDSDLFSEEDEKNVEEKIQNALEGATASSQYDELLELDRKKERGDYLEYQSSMDKIINCWKMDYIKGTS